jgi:bifunctional N-acetylglucosamine-1-phosphate-uridyltransferase/glucosamine-1-phosphate-acetyltransferase GlmU-like protein
MITLFLAGGEGSGDSEQLPPMLTPINRRTTLERVASQVLKRPDDRLIVLAREADNVRWNIRHATQRIDERVSVLGLMGRTNGATCTALLAIDEIDLEQELLVLASDEYVETEYADHIRDFRDSGADAGTLTFNSWHPRYSYVVVRNHEVFGAAEKDPISDTATAGFYWFRRGSLFVEAAMSQILKHDDVNGVYFVCPVLNQVILTGGSVRASMIDADAYIPLKSAPDIIGAATNQRENEN